MKRKLKKAWQFIVEEAQWAFKYKWDKVKSESHVVTYQDQIGVEFFVTYKHRETGKEKIQWRPAVF